jgi:hypothetical protein
MHLSPDDEQAIRAEFSRLTNLDQAELRAWLETTGEGRDPTLSAPPAPSPTLLGRPG